MPNPEEALAQGELAQKIIVPIRERELSQAEAAKIPGVDQTKVSALMRFLILFGQEIQIAVRSNEKEPARVLVASIDPDL